MATLHLKLKEAEIERFAIISGEFNRYHGRRILISGNTRDLLGYDFITDDMSSEESIANHLEILIHATEDKNRIAQREPLLIFRRKLCVNAYVDPDYFNYLLSLICDSSLKISLEIEVLLSEEEAEKTFWGMSKTRDLGFKHVKVDESCNEFEVIKSGIELDSKCENVMPSLIISSSKTAKEDLLSFNELVSKKAALDETLSPKEQPTNKNILMAIAILLFFILLKV